MFKNYFCRSFDEISSNNIMENMNEENVHERQINLNETFNICLLQKLY